MEIRDAVREIFWDYVEEMWNRYEEKEVGENPEFNFKDVNYEFVLPEFNIRRYVIYPSLIKEGDERGFGDWVLDLLYNCDDYEPNDSESIKKVISLLNDDELYLEVAEDFFDHQYFKDFVFGWDDEVEGYVLRYIGD